VIAVFRVYLVCVGLGLFVVMCELCSEIRGFRENLSDLYMVCHKFSMIVC
jgi:hypothetical protein